MRNIGPKTKRARRVGEALRDKDAKYLVKRNYPPGMHGQSRSRKSEYAVELLEKQKAKWIYGITERQFRRYIAKSTRSREERGIALLQNLELRLDNIVYRAGMASSRAQSRQLVSHGFFSVNGKKVNIPSFAVKVGSEIAVIPTKTSSKYIQQRTPMLKEHKPQEWLWLDPANLKVKVLSVPTFGNTASTLRPELIMQFYSR